ncbi:MAG: hypothetical protein WD227_16505 [Vicinamibacterales bacterium]
MTRLMVGVLAAAVLAAGCGKSEEEKRAEEAAKAAEQTAQSAEKAAGEAAKGLEAMAKGLEQMAAGSSGDQKASEPVKLQDLLATLPKIDGWEQQKPEGERMTSPFPTANAKATYTRGESRIEVEVVDSAFSQLLLAPVSMFLASGYSKETTTGHERSTTVNGQPGWEKWDSENKQGEVNALVGKRFLVTIEGSGIDGVQVLQDVASKMDFNRLASLK